jgi:hypothetical protein
MRNDRPANVVLEKSCAFALAAISLSRKLPANREFHLSISPMGPIRPIGLMRFTHKHLFL